jgi:putative FmdB family regulatory protein
MPTYEYRCPSCGQEFELKRPMSEAGTPTTCPACGSAAEKLVSGFASKTGFYVRAAGKPLR